MKPSKCLEGYDTFKKQNKAIKNDEKSVPKVQQIVHEKVKLNKNEAKTKANLKQNFKFNIGQNAARFASIINNEAASTSASANTSKIINTSGIKSKELWSNG